MFRFPNASVIAVAGALLANGCGQVGLEAESPEPVETSAAIAYDDSRVGYYGYGSPASAEEIAGWDIDIRPDGAGLPEGSGSVEDGEWLYDDQCAECHGTFGEGVGRFPVLAGGKGTLQAARPNKTVGSYWPYASTLYDYIRRTMPFTHPESLSDDETYALTAYVLYLNDLVDYDFVLNRENFTSIRLPNEGNFVPDPRPDVANVRCMENCRDSASIRILSEAVPGAVGASLEGDIEAPEAAAAAHPGESVYGQYCSICHDIGVAGAPQVGEAAAWTGRMEKGMDALVANAINGISSPSGVMPPKGGFTQLADEEVAEAVAYMVEASR
jgi:cytochrome c